jgi:hypothetical protein
VNTREHFQYPIGRYYFQWCDGYAQAPLAGERFLVLDRSWREQDVYGTEMPKVEIYTWHVESLDHEETMVVYELETELWFYTPEEAVEDFEANYFTEVIQEYPV